MTNAIVIAIDDVKLAMIMNLEALLCEQQYVIMFIAIPLMLIKIGSISLIKAVSKARTTVNNT